MKDENPALMLVNEADPTPEFLDQPAPATPSQTRFCNQCGAPRDPASSACPQCDQQSAAESAAQEQYRHDVRSIRSSVFLYFALLGISIVVMVWSHVTGGEESAMLDFVSSAAFSCLVLCWAASSFRAMFKLLTARFHPAWILAAGGAAVPTYLLASAAVNLLVSLGVEEVDYLAALSRDGFGFGWAILLVCVQPAIFEEVAFRGIIQGSLTPVLGAPQALVTSALMFGILHLSIPSLPHLLTLGLALGWLRLRTHSLLPGMTLHFCHNFLVILSQRTDSFLPW